MTEVEFIFDEVQKFLFLKSESDVKLRNEADIFSGDAAFVGARAGRFLF